VLWISVGVFCVLAVLIAVLATSKSASEEQASSPLIGKQAPPITGQSLLGGGRFSLAAQPGKWVLVNFSASWCVPCREEIPQLQAFESDHASSGNAAVVMIAADETDLSNLAAMLRADKATWSAVNDPHAQVDYGLGGLPESYLISPQGTVVAKFDGGVVAAQLNTEINKLSYGTA
jgi:cytochrome c biogenesis protein CcmG/thiol:disulfide interchange protein DsbE